MKEFNPENMCIGEYDAPKDAWIQKGSMMSLVNLNKELDKLRILNPDDHYCIMGISHELDY